MDYSATLVAAYLTNYELAEEFIYRTTGNLLVSSYETSRAVNPDFFKAEGHTLWNDAPQNSSGSKVGGGLKETLLIMKMDIERARKHVLTLEEDLALIFYFSSYRKAGRTSDHLKAAAYEALDKVVTFLNHG